MMISAKDQIITGLSSYSQAFKVISANKMGKYFVLPVILNIVLVAVLMFAGFGLGGWLSSTIETNTENMNGWIQAAMVAVKIVLPIVSFILFIFGGGTIVNVLMSPIYTVLSEKTDTYLTGRTFETNTKQTFSDIGRALVIAFKNSIKQLLLTILCLFLNFIPVIGSVVSVALIFIINAYYFGYGFMDYTYERQRYSAKESNRLTYNLRYLAITNGAVYALPLYMFCGTFFAAFLGGVSTVAATIAQLELERKN
ncbi:MAG: EI24 domain-containing protein [Bacteroidales bacterium]|nr:EI24 domain-containing protein [Bacteroidales bacterium]